MNDIPEEMLTMMKASVQQIVLRDRLSDKCKWVVREGTLNTYWAYTPCKKGFNYLSKTHDAKDIKRIYDNKQCPICGKPIECNMELFKDMTI